MLQAELVPRIHPFRRECGADSSSSDLHSGNRTSVSTPVSCLLAVQSAMTGFRPDSFLLLRNGLVRTAPVEWFSLSLAPGSAAAANPGYLLSDAQYDPAGRNLPAVFSICYDTRGFAILQAEFRP